jgi:hypothetical protein
MIKSSITAEGLNLHMQWIDQFVWESKQAMEQKNVLSIAQTVIFYASLHVQMEQQMKQETHAFNDWLLAPEEEVVGAALKLIPPSVQRLLHISLRVVMEIEKLSLTSDEEAYIRAHGLTYISGVREQVNRFADQWLH